MRKNTLLDFVLSTADPQSVREFWKVLAVGNDAKEAEKLLKKVIKMTERDENIDQADAGKLQKFFRKFYGKSKKSVLDMDPAELKQLLEVVRKEEDRIKIDTILNLEKDFVEPTTADALSVQVSRFYNQHKASFNSPEDIAFDPKNLSLKFNGPKDLAEQFLKQLQVNPDTQKEIMSQQHEQKFVKPVEPVDLARDNFTPEQRYEDFRGYSRDFKLQHPRDVTILTFDPDTGKLNFTMNEALLRPFLKGAGIDDLRAEEIVRQMESVEVDRADNTEKVWYVIPISELGETNKKIAQDQLNEWLKKNGHTTNMAKIGRERPDQRESPDALLFTGHPAELKNLLNEGFAVTRDVRDLILNNKDYQRSG
jgi:hypothetical protein